MGNVWAIVETCFTAPRGLIKKKDPSLIGHTSLWMFPVYALGLTYGFDFITYLIQTDAMRYASYPLWIWAVEIVVGFPALGLEFVCGITTTFLTSFTGGEY